MLKDDGNSTCCVDKDEKSKIKLEEFKFRCLCGAQYSRSLANGSASPKTKSESALAVPKAPHATPPPPKQQNRKFFDGMRKAAEGIERGPQGADREFPLLLGQGPNAAKSV